MRLLPLALLLATVSQAQQAQPDAKTIMARVAANQDQSESERIHYVYLQHARTASRKGKTVRCEEVTDIRVVPTSSGSHQQLLSLQGRLLDKHGVYQNYDHLAPDKDNPELQPGDDTLSIHTGDENMDRDLVEHMRNNFINSRSKDGIGAGLFPLTTKAQSQYTYRLVGRERMTGRDTFHITFLPTDKDDFGWKGDAYIDIEAFQPVLVHTTMARKLPFAVRTLLGTSLPGLGFTVAYAPQPGGLWFPVTFGTEFKMHVLFFLNREITLTAENRNFEQTHVTSTILPAQN